MDIGTVILGGAVTADPKLARFVDEDKDGIPELLIRFEGREAMRVYPLLIGRETIPVTWSMKDGTPYEAEAAISLVSPRKGNGKK